MLKESRTYFTISVSAFAVLMFHSAAPQFLCLSFPMFVPMRYCLSIHSMVHASAIGNPVVPNGPTNTPLVDGGTRYWLLSMSALWASSCWSSSSYSSSSQPHRFTRYQRNATSNKALLLTQSAPLRLIGGKQWRWLGDLLYALTVHTVGHFSTHFLYICTLTSKVG